MRRRVRGRSFWRFIEIFKKENFPLEKKLFYELKTNVSVREGSWNGTFGCLSWNLKISKIIFFYVLDKSSVRCKYFYLENPIKIRFSTKRAFELVRFINSYTIPDMSTKLQLTQVGKCLICYPCNVACRFSVVCERDFPNFVLIDNCL